MGGEASVGLNVAFLPPSIPQISAERCAFFAQVVNRIRADNRWQQFPDRELPPVDLELR